MFEYAPTAVGNWMERAVRIVQSIPEADRLSTAIVLQAMATADVATSVEKLAKNVEEIRTDHPLMGETFEGLSQSIQSIADMIAIHTNKSNRR